ncbi:hypothetical protein GTY67_05395 [Streptomyces sp. SID8374]|nr:hypothetical protein [Streptomyces sp. SID8374]
MRTGRRTGDSGGAVAAVRGPRPLSRTTTGPRATRVTATGGGCFRPHPAQGRHTITPVVSRPTRSAQRCCGDRRADLRTASYPARTLAAETAGRRHRLARYRYRNSSVPPG